MAGEGRRILMVAGEASGDMHASALIKAILKIDPSLNIYGIGGTKMEKAGLKSVYDLSRLSIVGLTEVFSRLPCVFIAYRKLKTVVAIKRPDVAVLVDYPEFNLFLARFLKRIGVPVIYFISPQIWAWRKKRIKKIARLVDKMIVIFPFEVPLYEREGVDVEFLGHPVMDSEEMTLSAEDARKKLGLPDDVKVISLLPGSRMKEVKNLLPAMIDASGILLKRIPDVKFLLPLADGIDESYVKDALKDKGVSVEIYKDLFYEVLKASDGAVVASGTATLQAALTDAPMVVVYKVSPLTYRIGKRLIKLKNISMVNIVAGKGVVEEYIQEDVTPEKIADGVMRLFDEAERKRILRDFSRVREAMGDKGTSERIAKSICDFINKRVVTVS